MNSRAWSCTKKNVHLCQIRRSQDFRRRWIGARRLIESFARRSMKSNNKNIPTNHSKIEPMEMPWKAYRQGGLRILRVYPTTCRPKMNRRFFASSLRWTKNTRKISIRKKPRLQLFSYRTNSCWLKQGKISPMTGLTPFSLLVILSKLCLRWIMVNKKCVEL